MHRRILCSFLLVLLAGAGVGGGAERRSPNVLFIVADDLNCFLGCYGDEVAVTPNLDRLAAGGTVFLRAYCQQAVCNPSRSSFLTGLRPDECGVDDLRKSFRATAPAGDSLITLPGHFKAAGYFTQGIGKIFHNMGDTQDRRSWSVDEQFHKGPHSEDTIYRSRAEPGAKLAMKAPATEALEVPDDAYWDGKITGLAIEALASESFRRQPFFLAVGFWRPHLPFVAPKRYWNLYDPGAIEVASPAGPPEAAPEISLHDSREISGYGPRGRTAPFTDDEIRHLRHGYYASISFLDAQVGRLLGALEHGGHRENTIIVFTSDHGFHTGEHGLWGKTTNFELDARVPLIIAAPGFTRGQTSTALCELIDLYPTLCDLSGTATDASRSLPGVSLRPVLEDPQSKVKEFALTQHQHPFYGGTKNWKAWGYSIRSERWRYTRWQSIPGGEVLATELYDYGENPLETRNLAGEDRFRDQLGALDAALDSARAGR